MAEVINLRRVRKRARRRDDLARADANRLAHGEPGYLRDLAKARQKKASRDLDAHRREREDRDDP